MTDKEKEGEIRYKLWLRDSLELLILIAIIILVIVIYIPRSIWNEEEADRSESRFRMVNVYDVLSLYHNLSGQTTEDGFKAMNLVNATRDSLVADTTFLGNQTIYLGEDTYQVDMNRKFAVEYDTLFGFLMTRKDTLSDTVLTVLTYNAKREGNDTSYIRINLIRPHLKDSLFVGVVDTVISSHVEIISYYDSFRPDSSMFRCPVIDELYRINVSEDGTIKVESPITEFKKQKFLVFSYKTESHGWIDGGEKSWVRF